MKFLYYILFFLLFSNCKQKEITVADQATIHIRDLENGEIVSLKALKDLNEVSEFERDTYPYYLRMFTISNVKEVFAATATFNPEKVTFYRKQNGNWNKIIYHEVDLIRAYEIFSRIEDFNFDGYQDIALHYSTSNGCASEYFQLFIYNPHSNSFKYIKAFSDLGCPIALYKEKVIRSRHASCGCGCFIINEHKWNGNTLKLVKDIVKDNHHDTLVTSFYNNLGKIIKEEKKVINFEDAQKMLDYYPINRE